MTDDVPAFERPIFVGGLFKSGTSLLRAMLGQHSNIASGLETYWFKLEWDKRDTEPMRARLAKLAQLFDFDEDVVLADAGRADSRCAFLARFMERVVRREGKARWLEKTPGNVFHIGEIFGHWPHARFIHIYRDPRDVYASKLEAGTTGGPKEFAEQWIDFAMAIDRHRSNGVTSSKNFLEICYEDLVVGPKKTTKNILTFLDEKWEAEVASFKGNKEDFDTVLKVMHKRSTTLDRLRNPLTRGRVGIWKDVVPSSDLEEIERLIGTRPHLSAVYHSRLCGSSAA